MEPLLWDHIKMYQKEINKGTKGNESLPAAFGKWTDATPLQEEEEEKKELRVQVRCCFTSTDRDHIKDY